MTRHFRKFSILCAVCLLVSVPLTACSRDAGTPVSSQTTPAVDPAITEQTSPAAEPVFDQFPFTFALDDGTECTVTLPRDPTYWAELHACDLDGSDALCRVILHNVADGTGVWIEEARVFSGTDGTEYPVTPVNEILSRYVTITAEDTCWRMTINGADYEISKSQFADYPADQLLDQPDLSVQQNFFVENGQLCCRVSMLCAGVGTGFAAESLRIRYGFDNGIVTAAEITFERPAVEDTAAESEETP